MTQANCISTVGVYAKGPKGDRGPEGTLTPELEQARDDAVAAAQSAHQSAQEAAESYPGVQAAVAQIAADLVETQSVLAQIINRNWQ